MIKIVIIEDEPAIREEIAWLVQQEIGTMLVGWSDNVQDCINLLEAQLPHVILMDIQLIDGSAFDVLNKLSSLPENIIFITAYDQFAIKAIKFGALDYLLKPIVQEELREALERYRMKKSIKSHWAQQLSITNTTLTGDIVPDSLALHSLNKIDIVMMKDIVYCKGDGPYTFFHLKGNIKILVSKPLKYYEDVLPTHLFIRPHQSYMVNIAYIDKIANAENLVLKNKEKIPISTRRKNHIINALSNRK